MSHILLCCAVSTLNHIEEMNNTFRWGRIVHEPGWHTDCRKESLYSLGTSGGSYNGFLGPLAPRLQQRRKKIARKKDSLPAPTEIRIAGSLVSRPEIEAYLERLCCDGAITLCCTNYELMDRAEMLNICSGQIAELSTAEAAQLWPQLITNERNRLRIKRRS